MKRRVALIIPYFGVLPHWFPYFVKSLANSSILDVYFFTDAQVSSKLASNLRVYRCSLAEFSALASRTLSIPVSLTTPYKVCDFKPAFGEIFQEYIHDYEFWAFGDIDLIYGDIDSFLQPLLANHDVISFRRGWISGSFCVMRNCKTVNAIYQLSADWKSALSTAGYQHFDEMGGFLFAEVLRGADVLSLKGTVDSFTHVVKRLARDGSLQCAFNDMACEYLPWGETVIYGDGKLTKSSDQSEVMYIHYVPMKGRYFEVPRAATVPDRFYIRKTGVYLNRPDVRTVVSLEAARVIRGSFHGARRRLRRYIGERLGTA